MLYMIAAAWMFVALLATAAEATSPQGTLLGAFFTLLSYGLLPLGLVLYLAATPHRRRARLRSEQSDGGDHAPARAAEALAPVGEEALVAERAPVAAADACKAQGA